MDGANFGPVLCFWFLLISELFWLSDLGLKILFYRTIYFTSRLELIILNLNYATKNIRLSEIYFYLIIGKDIQLGSQSETIISNEKKFQMKFGQVDNIVFS